MKIEVYNHYMAPLWYIYFFISRHYHKLMLKNFHFLEQTWSQFLKRKIVISLLPWRHWRGGQRPEHRLPLMIQPQVLSCPSLIQPMNLQEDNADMSQ